jgi:hypothetical protein
MPEQNGTCGRHHGELEQQVSGLAEDVKDVARRSEDSMKGRTFFGLLGVVTTILVILGGLFATMVSSQVDHVEKGVAENIRAMRAEQSKISGKLDQIGTVLYDIRIGQNEMRMGLKAEVERSKQADMAFRDHIQND